MSSTGRLAGTGQARGAVEVASTTLDRALAGRHVDVIKIDIEGGEPRALAGMAEIVATSPSLVAFVECNPKALARAGTSAAELVAGLHALGFDVSEIDEQEGALRPLSEALLAPERADDPKFFVNLYCRKDSS